ncbi:hypothetical protein [Blastococcus sp. LR1]|uniref:hypothetical protein n=1 Tax=Blastococcus sp. LR1 TaxID=2877000 RepID=UPI001CCEB48A|nr:hypothetical protein [Blastococcus sp. LR1]MCA0146751.1 hypothetical protein [Blastococcus sp. LR1]
MSPENPALTSPAVEAVPAAGPSWAKRNSAKLVAGLLAFAVVAGAIAGLLLWRSSVDERNADTEAAFEKMVAEQGASVTTVECDGDTCSAIIGGQALSVLVQEDDKGEQQFGVVAFTG